jgi:TackOD1 domain-containing protein
VTSTYENLISRIFETKAGTHPDKASDRAGSNPRATTRADVRRGDTRLDLRVADLGYRPVPRPLIMVPLCPDGSPSWEHRVTGASVKFSPAGKAVVRWPTPVPLSVMSLIALLPEAEGGYHAAAAIEVDRVQTTDGGGQEVHGWLGGYAAELLQPDNLMPRLHPENLTFQLGFPEEVLDRWAAVHVLRPVWLDRVQVCPRCRALPTFRRGCRNCGAARLETDRLIHHFPCAHVGLVRDFEQGAELVCPKCRARPLVPGADFEYQTGPYRCGACQWSDIEREEVAQCLRCRLRFPAGRAAELELKGYCANRLDLLALAQAP